MSFKPFFVHFNRPVRASDSSRLRHSPRGFTAYVTPGNKPRELGIQVAFCSTQDEFVKQKGRSHALAADLVVFNPRELPNIMARCAETCNAPGWFDERAYMYLLKYVV